jgi:predicted PurR-regulated permease PerM
MPEYQANVQAKLHSVNDYFIAALSKVTRTAEDFGQSLPLADPAAVPEGTPEHPYAVRVLASPASPLQMLSGTFGSVIEVLGLAGIVIILVVFFLVRREDLRDRFIRLAGRNQLSVTTQMLEDAATRVSRYLSMLFRINATFGIGVGIGLYLIGVPNAVLWGILAATLRFIPYIGPWIAAAMPIGLSMAISTGWVEPICTVALFVVLELFSNNVMEPWLYGKNTGMSPVAILVAAVFWTWLWGFAGLLLATPLTVCLLVIGKHIPQLSFLDVLLGNEPVFEPKRRVYQRLLAGDQEEATELFEDDLENRPLVEVYDTLLIPALALAEISWRRGELDQAKRQFILQSLEEMIREAGESQQEVQTNVAIDSASQLCIVCVPARDEADAIAGMMLAQLLRTSDCRVQSILVPTAAGELANLVEQYKADVVCISATPPSAVMHARHLCKHLRRRFPKLQLVIGLWNAQGDLSKAKSRIGCGDTTHVVPTLAEAQDRVGLLIQSFVPTSDKQVHPDAAPGVLEEVHT